MPLTYRTSDCQPAPRGALRFLLLETTPRPKPSCSGSSMKSGSILWMRACLAESWRQQPGTPVYGPDFVTAGVQLALSQASRERPVEFRAEERKGTSD